MLLPLFCSFELFPGGCRSFFLFLDDPKTGPGRNCGLYLDMMGGSSSKKKGGSTPPPPPPADQGSSHLPSGQVIDNAQFAANLSSYEEACNLDTDLRTFDSTLHERTSRVINSLATGIEVRSLSLDSLKEVTSVLLEMNQDVAKVILQDKKDIWNNRDLFSLVEDYFECSIGTLDFCTELDSCLKRARNSQFILQFAVRQFEGESEMQNDVIEKKYTRILEELQKFKAAGDPFSEEFFILFQSVYRQQVSMFQKLQLRKRKLDKKLKSMKTWRRVSNVLFVAAFVSVLIFSVVAAAISAPPIVTAMAGALAVPLGSVGRWCNSLWNKYQKEVKGQRELVSSLEVGTFVTMTDMDGIRSLVSKLEIQVGSLIQNAEFALAEEDAMKVVIDEIKKKLEVFTATIDELGQHVAKCSRDVRQARAVILQRIIKYP